MCGIQYTRAVRKLHLQGPSTPGSERVTGLGAVLDGPVHRGVLQAAALAWVALFRRAALHLHTTRALPLLPADKDVLRLMQLADRFLMEDCVRRCATLLNQIPVSRR